MYTSGSIGTRPAALAIAALLAAGISACGGSSDSDQTPPMGRAALEQWLSGGAYKGWRCEGAAHPARSPSPHGVNRICSNAKVSAAGSGEYPVGSASVKELFDSSNGLIGYAVALHTSAGKTGDTWYWYERVPSDSPVPHDANGVVADAPGASGPAKDICVGCHAAAGSDAMHSGHDFIYTQVR